MQSKYYFFFLLLLLFSTNLIEAQWVKCSTPYIAGISQIGTYNKNFYALNYTDPYLNYIPQIFISNDTGKTWSVFTTLPEKDVLGFIIKSSKIFYYTSSGVYRSTDYRNSWQQMFSMNSILNLYTNDQNIFVTTAGMISYCSTDDGDNWIKIGAFA
jgi:hypothetical protein